MIGVQLLNFNKQNSLLTTSTLCMLVGYYTWAAGYSHPSSHLQTDILYSNMAVSFFLLLLSTAGSIYGSTNLDHKDLETNSMMVDLDNPSMNIENERE